ncbi:hypothetical protein QI097_00480 [Staphylococcus saprophyticus]|nr:hypothetical protein [Staphylococcus saprophyticus]
MKIKTKKQFTLPQLIEWGFNNPGLAKGRVYQIDDENAIFVPYVSFPADGSGVKIPFTITHDNTFTVETEEEITEDTVIDEMLLIYDNGVTHIAENKNLSFISKGNLKSAYYMNDELRLILIWRDGRLVE